MCAATDVFQVREKVMAINSTDFEAASMENLFGKSLEDLQALCETEGLPKYSARQICDWLYAKHIVSIDDMTNISLKHRLQLKQKYTIKRHLPIDCQVSCDGTKKYVFSVAVQPLKVGKQAQEESHPTCGSGVMQSFIESVYIPDGDRATLCVSCQAGCRMGCRFCVTGSNGFRGNLTASEILNQVFSIPEFSDLSNIVYMGMGEPFDNYEAVMQSIKVITAEWGLAWSPHRITVSTVGLLPGIERFLRESECHLAISLHNPVAEERATIMPMQKTYPIADTLQLLKTCDWSGQRRLSFEYTVFAGLNDDKRHADVLVGLIGHLRCRVNLIRFHASPGMSFRAPTGETMQRFMDYLCARGIRCTIRASRGEDIMAACGLLAGVKSGQTKA